MKLSDITKSRFFKSEDFARPRRLVIESVQDMEVGQDQNKKIETVIFFRGEDQGLILKTTNILILAEIAGSGPDDEVSETWPGLEIEVYRDPSVMFKGQRMGGTRIRAVSHAAPIRQTVQPQRAAVPAQQNPDNLVTDEEIPDPGAPLTSRQKQATGRF